MLCRCRYNVYMDVLRHKLDEVDGTPSKQSVVLLSFSSGLPTSFKSLLKTLFGRQLMAGMTPYDSPQCPPGLPILLKSQTADPGNEEG